MPIERFWQLSLLEITDFMESEVRRMKREQKQKLKEIHFLAQDIGQYTSLAVHGSENVQVMELWDFSRNYSQKKKKNINRYRPGRWLYTRRRCWITC